MRGDTPPQVIIFPRGQLSSNEKGRLMKHGILAIEADDPSKVVTVVPGASMVGSDDLMLAALDALANTPSYNSSSSFFVAALAKRALAKEKKS